MEYITLIPTLGLKSAYPANHHSMLVPLGNGVYLSHAADIENMSFKRTKGACRKCEGYATYSGQATNGVNCAGIFEYLSGPNTRHYYFGYDGSTYGSVFRMDESDASLDKVTVAGSIEFKVTQPTYGHWDAIRFGDYLVVADDGSHTPYCCTYNGTLVKLITSGTEYKFKFLEGFDNRIFGAYSDQTNGGLEVRWSELLPVPGTSCTFGASDALYKSGEDVISAVKRLGSNQFIVYGHTSIHAIDPYPYYATPYSMRLLVANEGTANKAGIIAVGNSHYFWNRHYGFVEYRGGSEFPYGRPLSEDIEDRLPNIDNPASGLCGAFNPKDKTLIWAVPYSTASTYGNKLFIYDLEERRWTIEDKTTVSALCYWENLGAPAAYNPRFYFAKNDFAISGYTGDDFNTGNYTGYRVEPAIDFSGRGEMSMLREIWFDFQNVGNYSVDLYLRQGNTIGELEGSGWTSIGSLSCNSPNNPVLYIKAASALHKRYHQLKWLSDAKDEPLGVTKIKFGFEVGASY